MQPLRHRHYFRRQGFSIDIVQFPETDFAAIARG